jgi:hypothetical protein
MLFLLAGHNHLDLQYLQAASRSKREPTHFSHYPIPPLVTLPGILRFLLPHRH